MLIEIHMIQNHAPANLNRDDLGAPKTCWFGGVLRCRISSQCLKRSIRMSEEFKLLCGGIRTRRLPQELADIAGRPDLLQLATDVVRKCGVLASEESDSKDVIVFLSRDAAKKMADKLRNVGKNPNIKELAREFANLITAERHIPDMALSGRMLEPSAGDKESKEVWKGLDRTVEAALQCCHAISTHTARPEVDYFVAADDVPGEDAGGAHIGEAMFASACFYKYFSIHWEQLVENLKGFQGNREHLAAHTVGAFLRGAALTTPTGKQNSYAAQNHPDGILVEIRNSTPVSYANAFAKPVEVGERDLVSQSIAQLAGYIHDLDEGYGKPKQRFWFSPNLKYPLVITQDKQEFELAENNIKSLDEFVLAILHAMGFDWSEVQKTVINPVAAQ